MRPFFKTFIVFILYSKIVVTPNSLLGAMCAGKAIIYGNIGQIQEIVSDQNKAIPFDAGSAEQLASAIGVFHNDPELINKLGN